VDIRDKRLNATKDYFDLPIGILQTLGAWTARCAERSVSIYERIQKSDDRPRRAIIGIAEFADSGKRTTALRKLALDAYRASLETKNEAASAAARSASLAAASAYTHPFTDVNQAKHILGSAAYTVLAIELSHDGDEEIGKKEIEISMAGLDYEIVALVKKMPAQKTGKKRIDQLFHEIDRCFRSK
jgi:hypothetical protein